MAIIILRFSPEQAIEERTEAIAPGANFKEDDVDVDETASGTVDTKIRN